MTRRLEHETVVLGVSGSEDGANELVRDDLRERDFSGRSEVHYLIQSHGLT